MERWEWTDLDLGVQVRLSGAGLQFQPIGLGNPELKELFWVRVPTHLVQQALKNMPANIPSRAVLALIDGAE